jgi:hypothetical protein
MCGTLDPAYLYQIPISSDTMGTPVQGPSIGTAGNTSYYGRCSPITEFYNSYEASATGSFTFESNPTTSWANTVYVTVELTGSPGTLTTYTFVSGAPTAANQVELSTGGTIGNDEDHTADNLEAVINDKSSECYSGTPNCVFSGQSANSYVSATVAGATVSLTATTAGTAGDFTLGSYSTADVHVSGGANGENGHDYIFLSVFAGSLGSCSSGSSGDYNGCVLSFDVTTPTNFSTSLAFGGTLNLSAPNLLVPTSGLVVDNGVNSPPGSSQIYFETLDPSGSSPCAGICGVQAQQSSP